jgi:hypothetical protein
VAAPSAPTSWYLAGTRRLSAFCFAVRLMNHRRVRHGTPSIGRDFGSQE